LISAVVENFEITTEDDRIYEIPIEAGYLLVSYDPAAEYEKTPDRAVVKSQAGPGRRISVIPDTPVPATPGEYMIKVPTYIGVFEDVVVTVIKGGITKVVLTPKGK